MIHRIQRNAIKQKHIRTYVYIVLSIICISPVKAQIHKQQSIQNTQKRQQNNKQQQQHKSHDSEQLGKALEYFSGNKYHEALNIFEELDKKYKLNDRFRAYMGICYYYEWDYKKACEYMEYALPNLEVYAPHERSVYYHIAAESYFNLEEYGKAIPLYEKQLNVCYDNEKADAYYRIGFCYMLKENWSNARDFFHSALEYYKQYSEKTSVVSARIIQIQKMLSGIDKRITEEEQPQ